MDVTTCLPQDITHVLIEGVLTTNIKLLIKYCLDQELFDIIELNDSITNFDYEHLKNDKPAKIEIEHLDENGSLRQSAAQLITLSQCLLFTIGEWIINNESEDIQERIDCYVKLLQILNVCCAYEIKEESVEYLGYMIKVF